MSEVLLQTIVEKLESMEIALLKDNRSAKDYAVQTEILQHLKSLLAQLRISDAQLNRIIEKMARLSEEKNLLNSNENNHFDTLVKHIHHFHKLVWVTAALFLICLSLGYGWMNCYKQKKSIEANDIKYRYWQTDSNVNLLKLTSYTDSLYNLDKDDFKKRVVHREEQFARQEKMNQLAGEKKK